VTHGYDEKTLFKNTNLQIDRGERVAMIGANGCGKSTLMRLMQGVEQPISGIATLGDADLCKVNYFYQNQAEGLDTNKGVLQTLVEAAPDEQLNDLKALLGQMKFSTSFHNKPVKFLSGGEKARLALAKFMVTPANVLLLDEPTNHLDIPSKEMLEEAIKNFDGSVIAISHDRYFLRQIATRVLNFDEGKITDYAGDYAYFLEKNDKAGSRDQRLQKQAKEVEKKQIVSKSKMSKAEKAKLKKEKAKAFGGGSGAAKKNKNAGRWN
jgi:ATPase subunit of ABC transporter with duplicated ATPase domains